MIMAIKQAVASVAVNQALAYLEKDPERNIEKLLNWIDAFDRRGRIDKPYEGCPSCAYGP